MEITDIIGDIALDERSLRQMTGRGGFIDVHKPRIIESAKQTPLGWIWRAQIGTREVTILTAGGTGPVETLDLLRADINAVLYIRPTSTYLKSVYRPEGLILPEEGESP